MERHELILRCAEFSANAHAGQFRKNSRVPYIVHPAGVAMLAGLYGGQEDVSAICTAWLHDVKEDTDADLGQFLACLDFATETTTNIMEYVEWLTNPESKADRATRKSEACARLMKAPPAAVLVKMCDRYDNIQDVENLGKFAVTYLQETDQFVRTVGARAYELGFKEIARMLESLVKTKRDSVVRLFG